jgi:hypothetical protein
VRFKQFIERQIGLGDLGNRMGKIFKQPQFDSFSGSFSSSDMTGTEKGNTSVYTGHALSLPSTDLTIPQIRKEGRIVILERNKNPIYIKLSDGTEAYFTYDEFRRIKGKPEVGQVMRITFQRHPADASKNHSKIDSAEVI